MAQRSRSHPDNVPGSFFVDRTCIDCGTCYEYLPWVFGEAGDHSRVHRQPAGDSDQRHALLAALACPTGSIGTDHPEELRAATGGFPEPIEEEVAFCGYTSEHSYGAWSYFIRRPAGNVLVDSPRPAPPLLAELERQGGVALLVLSHRDDVADHARLRERFGCQRVLHRRDLGPAIPEVELPIAGDEPFALAPDLLVIPTPGHTAGHDCLLYRDKFLFSGDHLAWNPHRGMLSAFRDYCWFDWATQLRSLERLLEFDFTWVLPGHGTSHRAGSPEAMRRDLEKAIRHLKDR